MRKKNLSHIVRVIRLVFLARAKDFFYAVKSASDIIDKKNLGFISLLGFY
jgi:hypothetical protein